MKKIGKKLCVDLVKCNTLLLRERFQWKARGLAPDCLCNTLIILNHLTRSEEKKRDTITKSETFGSCAKASSGACPIVLTRVAEYSSSQLAKHGLSSQHEAVLPETNACTRRFIIH